MMHRRTVGTTAFAVSTSPPGRPPRSPAAALLASSTAPAAAPSSTCRMASRSTRAAPLRSLRCMPRPQPPHRAISRIASLRTRCVGRTHSRRHATSRTGLARFTQTPSPRMTGRVEPPHPPCGVKPNRNAPSKCAGLRGTESMAAAPLATQPATCAWRSRHLHRRERGGGRNACGLRDNRTSAALSDKKLHARHNCRRMPVVRILERV